MMGRETAGAERCTGVVMLVVIVLFVWHGGSKSCVGSTRKTVTPAKSLG